MLQYRPPPTKILLKSEVFAASASAVAAVPVPCSCRGLFCQNDCGLLPTPPDTNAEAEAEALAIPTAPAPSASSSGASSNFDGEGLMFFFVLAFELSLLSSVDGAPACSSPVLSLAPSSSSGKDFDRSFCFALFSAMAWCPLARATMLT
mmetsp:Transcript_38069/g.63202  ORF Transcript_38069/g.63202 Transcript_38069/m.63202 type:complete len:149 (+) Transcript_38069:491-937(+)